MFNKAQMMIEEQKLNNTTGTAILPMQCCVQYGLELNKIYNESNLDTMKRMPDNFVDLTVTSPPYDNLREYNGYSFPFEDIAKELYRVTKKGGVLVWVVGDAVIDGGESGTSFRQALYFQQIGFLIHDTMIYEKNGAAYPANDKSNRYSQVFEYMFVLSKGKPKTYNLLKDKPNRWAGSGTFGTNSERQKDGTIKERGSFIVPDFSYRNNIWKINNGYGYSSEDDIAYMHPAIFPEQLAQDHIWTWSNEGDLVYDCFGGSGTTAKMAHKLKRNWILSEISSEYVQIAEKRIAPYLAQTSLF
jgi:site-specific DNA-methyltransferase (adenine-specific)